MLEKIFIPLILQYSHDETIAFDLWNEIEKQYSSRKRHYHNLTHIEALINELSEYRSAVKEWDILLFSIFYHDIIYNVLKSDNEEKSAALAAKRLILVQLPINKIKACEEQILSTKTHVISSNPDTNLFTDADLSILGQSPEIYQLYYLQIRKEYSIYPNIIYNPGRKKVLAHFLAMERIYKTQTFFEKYEKQARENLKEELSYL